MKTKYERMSKKDKKELIKKYKDDNYNIYIKFSRMFTFCYLGIVISFLSFIYDYLNKSIYNLLFDIVLFVFCFVVLFMVNKRRKLLLNDYALKK